MYSGIFYRSFVIYEKEVEQNCIVYFIKHVTFTTNISQNTIMQCVLESAYWRLVLLTAHRTALRKKLNR